jgi:hypothetical protein
MKGNEQLRWKFRDDFFFGVFIDGSEIGEVAKTESVGYLAPVAEMNDQGNSGEGTLRLGAGHRCSPSMGRAVKKGRAGSRRAGMT